MTLRHEIAATLAPAIDCNAPYAKVMIDRLVKIAEEASAEQLVEIARLKAWVSDLQSGTYVNCVYCGHRYGPGETTPVSMADALKAHVAQCAEHPMARLVGRMRSAAAQCGNVIFNCEQRPSDNDRHLASWRGVKEFIDAAVAETGGRP